MRGWLVLVAIVVGCYGDPVVHCPTVLCPTGMVCDNHDGCALKEQLESCADQADGTPCEYPAVADGECSGELCVPRGCGNGIITSDEVCDDGNTNNGDGCSADCHSLETCGNGIVDPAKGEQCDGTPNCRPECVERHCGDGTVDPPFETCDNGPANSNTVADACRLNCQTAHCGDGVPDSTEGCDDGNTINGDGCSADCRVEECGNGIVEGHEQCDDGALNGSGPNQCRTVTCLLPFCGDTIVDSPFEGCDGGGALSDTAPDACRTNCQPHRCGDGVVDTGEACDDGNNTSGDHTCSADCLSNETCGNGIVDPGEQCDNGAANSATAADACRSGTCQLPKCGDGVTDTLEGCDGGAANSDTTPDACRKNCQPPRCGDHVIDSNEVCDDGNNVSGDGTCSADCKSTERCGDGVLNSGTETCDCGDPGTTPPTNCGVFNNDDDNVNSPCRADCSLRRCGDGILEQPEQCEGTNVGGHTCQEVGFYGGTLRCTPFCGFDTGLCAGKCGDDIVQTENNEQCDGLNMDGHTCASFGFYTGQTVCAGCTVNLLGCSGFCGDGIKNGPEKCDRGELGTDFGNATCATVDPGKSVGPASLLTCAGCDKIDFSKCAHLDDGLCEAAKGETCQNSIKDCKGDEIFCCGNGVCSPAENAQSCPADCVKP